VSLNPYATPATPSGSSDLPGTTVEQDRGAPQLDDWVQRYRQSALVVVLVAAFAEGLLAESSLAARVVVPITFASALTLWCGLDAHVHGKLFLRSYAWALMFTWPVGVAVHLVWTRGTKGLFTYALAGVTCIAAAVAGLTAASIFGSP
jgi:hypothetical protein